MTSVDEWRRRFAEAGIEVPDLATDERFRAPARSSPTPMLTGDGPAEFSTCTEMLRSPVLVHDVNGYYRALGVGPRATRRQLREAYQRKGGPDSPWLTYVLKQLLDPQVRAEYDRCHLGEPYLDDYWIAYLNRRARERASQMAAQAREMGIDLDSVESERDLLRQFFAALGLDATWDEDTPDETVDSPEDEHQDRPSPARHLAPAFGYSYYQWRSRCDDIERLADWQNMLIQAFSRRGISTHLSVGFHGRQWHPWVLARVGYRLVVFLNEHETPTVADAAAVATRVAQDQHDESETA